MRQHAQHGRRSFLFAIAGASCYVVVLVRVFAISLHVVSINEALDSLF